MLAQQENFSSHKEYVNILLRIEFHGKRGRIPTSRSIPGGSYLTQSLPRVPLASISKMPEESTVHSSREPTSNPARTVMRRRNNCADHQKIKSQSTIVRVARYRPVATGVLLPLIFDWNLGNWVTKHFRLSHQACAKRASRHH